MSGSKFSTSRGTVIYVGDFLKEFGPDALRYFIAVAGPENQDTDFTWDEFVRRTNFELANEWGNLVNRSISMAHKNVGAVPKPVAPADADAELLAISRAGFDTVGGLLGRNRFKQAVGGGHAGGLGGQPVPVGPGAMEAQGRPRPARHDPAHRAAGRAGREHAAHAVPAARGAAGARGARRQRGVGGAAGDPGGRRPRRRPVLPGPHRRLRGRAGAVGVHADRGRPPAGPAHADLHQARPEAGGDGARSGPRSPGDPVGGSVAPVRGTARALRRPGLLRARGRADGGRLGR